MQEPIIVSKTFDEARKKIKEFSPEKIVFSSSDDELNRKIAEKLDIAGVLINLAGRKDFQKQRDSGFNQVMAKTFAKKKIFVGINLDEIIDANKFDKAKILGRLRQTIKLCNKNKVNMKFIGQKHSRNIYDLRALGTVLGMPTWMTSDFAKSNAEGKLKKSEGGRE